MRDDLRSAVRQIRRHPGFAVAVVLTLGLGVGAVVAVLTLADPILFRALPFPRADRLYMVRASGGYLHVPDVLRAETDHDGFAAIGEDHAPVDSGPIGSATDTSVSYPVTRGYLRALGVQPVVGRLFRDDEHTADHRAGVALISYGLWQSAFAGRPDIIGQAVSFSGPRNHRYEIVGVLPPAFFVPDASNRQPAVLIPGDFDRAETRPNRLAFPLARLKDGVSVAAATAEMQAIVTAVERDYPGYEQGRRVKLVPLRDWLFGDARTPLTMLLSATLCVLLLAAGNLAHLVMARLRGREREVGIRLAIGASRWRVSRLFAVEALVICAAGGVAALMIGGAASRLLISAMPPLLHTYRLVPAHVDTRVAALGLAMLSLVVVVSVLVPILRISRREVRATLSGVTVNSTGQRILRSDAMLIFAQSAVGIALLVTGLLIARSFVQLANRPLGFDPGRVRIADIELPPDGASTPERRLQMRRTLYQDMKRRIPAALIDGIPGMTLNTGISRPDFDGRAGVNAWPVSGTFFSVFGLRLVRGRLYTDEEAFANAAVVVIDQRAADLLWPGLDPLGRTVREIRGPLRTVIGIVQTVRTDLLGTRFQTGGAFVPFAEPRLLELAYRVDRTDPPAAELEQAISVVVPGARVTMRPVRIFERQLSQPRFLAFLLGALGVLAVILTVVGVLGVVNHEVTRRTKEMGIRLALGADASRIRRLVLGGALIPALLGSLLGLSASLWFTETLRALLYGLSPQDPAVYAVTLAAMLATVALGTLAPAWRASRTDPMISLRAE